MDILLFPTCSLLDDDVWLRLGVNGVALILAFRLLVDLGGVGPEVVGVDAAGVPVRGVLAPD